MQKTRLRGKPMTKEALAEIGGLAAEPAEHKGRWHSAFGNGNDIHIELGCGLGGFITEAALQNTGINFIAFERISKILAHALRLSKDKGSPPNLLFAHADADALEQYFEPGEVKRIYINFCDPWRNKRRWHKRRLTHRNFLSIYGRLLPEGGELFFKTDNETLFNFSVSELADMGWRLGGMTRDLANNGFEGNIVTEYEKRFMEKGMPIFRLEAVKTLT